MVHPSPELFTCSFLRSAFFMLFRGPVFYLHKLGVGDKPASDILFSNQYLLIGLLLDLGKLVGLLLEKEIKVKSV